MLRKRLGLLIGALAGAAALAGCGSGEHARYADNLGPGYVELDNLNYQIQISRQLNPYSDEDGPYLTGFTAKQRTLPPTQEWLGVSLQVYNWSNRPHTPTRNFYITNTIGERFDPLINPAPNPFSYVPFTIPSGKQLPTVTSDAYAGWTAGEFLIFKVPYRSLPNRPFVLHIVNPANRLDQARIELDL
jgi:hypothetical protein